MSGIHTETLDSVHPYTRSDIPWENGGNNLLRAYGRTVAEAKRARRRNRFLMGSVVFWGIWLLLYVT